ncbi:fungal-specific transcription factor domain-containing protein [Colletotrichum navitas]|uniref:Fungal-specific transcription factor domain-containing protein n=1 Tax=Colletotrichum navitas TaxID=681940 RepID=A0AAD8PVI5_9PEZI|nr:fungal-specific transcription factor domain-containing protein [Colletotrichum navitas]KAK1585455.1 fungal-specific transcription factor domain-containing protein [Colletotrichum navitas]
MMATSVRTISLAEEQQGLPYRGARFPSKFRRNFPRSKEGCLTCRTRRKKCDEVKPDCTLCRRSGRECSWPVIAKSDGPEETTASSNGKAGLQKEPAKEISHSRRRLMQSDFETASPAVVVGSKATKAMSPLRSSLTFGTLSQLDEVSRPSYEQYLAVTTFLLVRGRTSEGNPFINYVLPLAASDGLIMDCVLAIGGAHMSVLDAKNRQLEVVARGHYARALAGLRKVLAGQAGSTLGNAVEDKQVYVVLVLLLLCILEGIQGDVNGAVYHHLRATRQYVAPLAAKSRRPSPHKLQHIHGFLLEIYTVFALELAITPRGKLDDQPVDLDPFLESLAFLGEYKSCGFMLGFGHGLFGMIPEIAKLIEARRAENLDKEAPSSLYQSYRSLVSRLNSWDEFADVLEGDGLSPRYEQATAANIYRNALIIYLHAAFHDNLLDSPELVAEIEVRIDKMLPLCWAFYSGKSPLRRMMLWPVMVLASCCSKRHHVEAFRYGLNINPRAPGAVRETARVVQLLWEDKDPRAFGPRGLDWVMKKHGISISVC